MERNAKAYLEYEAKFRVLMEEAKEALPAYDFLVLMVVIEQATQKDLRLVREAQPDLMTQLTDHCAKRFAEIA